MYKILIEILARLKKANLYKKKGLSDKFYYMMGEVDGVLDSLSTNDYVIIKKEIPNLFFTVDNVSLVNIEDLIDNINSLDSKDIFDLSNDNINKCKRFI